MTARLSVWITYRVAERRPIASNGKPEPSNGPVLGSTAYCVRGLERRKRVLPNEINPELRS